MKNIKHKIRKRENDQEEVIISFENLDVSEIQKLIFNTYFFIGYESGKKILSDDFKKTPIKNFNFPIRFKNSLHYFPKIINLENLLNTDYVLFLNNQNLGDKTLVSTRKNIIEHLNNNYSLNLSYDVFDQNRRSINKISSQINELIVPFFENGEITPAMINDLVLKINLKEINFPTRFENYLSSRSDLSEVKDILNIPPAFFYKIKNVGRKTIKAVQKILENVIKNTKPDKIYRSYPGTQYVDRKILIDIRRVLRKQRYIDIFLKRAAYASQEVLTYDNIGRKFKLTRERIRQILNKCEHILSSKNFIFEEILKLIQDYGYVIDITKLYYFLINKRKWQKKNNRFLNYIINFLNCNDYLFIEGNYILLLKPTLLKPVFDRIIKIIVNIMKNKKEGISINKVLSILKLELCNIQLDLNKLLTMDTLEYLSKTFKEFYIVNKLLYNQMMYQIYHGILLKDVTFWSLKYFSRPMHFIQLAKFIRNNNNNFREVSDDSVHSTLNHYDFFRFTNHGIYVLKDAKMPKHKLDKKSSLKHLKEKKSKL